MYHNMQWLEVLTKGPDIGLAAEPRIAKDFW